MKKEINAKLVELVELLNDPDEVVLDKEVKEKLENIIGLLDHPEDVVAAKKALNEKMETIKKMVNDTMIDLDVDVEYCMEGNPHILLSYPEDQYTVRTRKVSLGHTAMQSTPEDFTKHVLLAIEEFKDEIDDVKMG